MIIDFYKKVGFTPPWICYYAQLDEKLVGSAGFKGQPINGVIEIVYGTFENYRKQGMGTSICKSLVDPAIKTDPSLRITARTLPERNFSTRILQKNKFEFTGIVHDPEDGEVWEWTFNPNTNL
jgi:[ribosomal protein S5]-alanine N-acetyltransferase